MKVKTMAMSAILLLNTGFSSLAFASNNDYQKKHLAQALKSAVCQDFKTKRSEAERLSSFLKEHKVAIGITSAALLASSAALAYGPRMLLAANEKLNPGVTELVNKVNELSKQLPGTKHSPEVSNVLKKFSRLRFAAKVVPKSAIAVMVVAATTSLTLGTTIALEYFFASSLGESREKVADALEADPSNLYSLRTEDACLYLFDFPHVKQAFEDMHLKASLELDQIDIDQNRHYDIDQDAPVCDGPLIRIPSMISR